MFCAHYCEIKSLDIYCKLGDFSFCIFFDQYLIFRDSKSSRSINCSKSKNQKSHTLSRWLTRERSFNTLIAYLVYSLIYVPPPNGI